MILKIFKAVWFLSVLAVLANLLFTYASLPEEVVVQEESDGKILAGRELFFYVFTAVVVIVNVLVYLFKPLFSADLNFRAWFHGLVITINVFLVVALNLVQVYNSAENFNYGRVSFIIYGSLFLMVGWAISWPIYSIFRKFFPKEAIS